MGAVVQGRWICCKGELVLEDPLSNQRVFFEGFPKR